MFELGEVVMTVGIANSNLDPVIYLARHTVGDWGDLCDEDKELNDEAVRTGEDRIMSAYKTNEGKVYVITEWDRSVTTILFAEEY